MKYPESCSIMVKSGYHDNEVTVNIKDPNKTDDFILGTTNVGINCQTYV